MRCARCGSDAPEDARFCPACGNELGAPSSEERKLVSILFVDMVGSTSRADGADPEDVRDRTRLFFEEARGRIERHGGVVEKYIGDAVMAVFGAPIARSDDAERAVRAALAVIEGVETLNAGQPDLDLAVRAAVCSGAAVVATEPAPGAPLATGDVINVAARLQSAAPTGRVIVDVETHRLTRHAFTFEELAPIVAKGKREPVAAWVVGRPLGAPALRPVSGTPLVGRDREVALIRMVWERAVAARRPHLVTILGPSGIGKSRLAREISAEVEDGGGRAVWGRSLPYEEQTPFHALGQIVRDLGGIFENDPAEVARTKLAVLVGKLFLDQEAPDTTRYLSLLLGLGLDAPTSDPIHLRYACRRLLERLAEQQPLLIVFEDLDWADDALLELVDYLVSHVRDAPVVFLALARAEFAERRPTWGAGMVGQTVLPLDPLTDREAAEVVASLLDRAPPDVVDRVVTAAGGNPLFLEELMASLGDDAAPGELPSTVRAAIGARIDALPPTVRKVLLHASVIGRSFWQGVLERIEDLPEVPVALGELEARGLVLRRPRSQVEGDTEFAIKHDLVRDVAYETLPRATRRQLHAATARTIESSVEEPRELAWILAHHWREAGEPARAVGYFLDAADRARDALAVAETYEYYSRALELAEGAAERRQIRLRRGLAMATLEDYARADRELGELLPDLEGEDLIEALLARSRSTLWTERTAETMALTRRLFELVEAEDRDEFRGPAFALLADAHAMRGDEGDLDTAIDHGDRALEVWVPGTRRLELAEHYHLHADTMYWTGDYERALELSRLAAEAGGGQPHSAEAVLRGAGMQGLALAGLGRYEEAIRANEAAISIAREMGRSVNVVTNYSTSVLRDIFDLDEARRRSEEVADRLGPSDFNMPWMNARADVITVCLLLDDVGAAARLWPSAWEDAQGVAAWEHWLVSGRLAAVRADLELELGNLEDALTWARRALDMAVGTRRRKYEVASLVVLGRALAAQGRADDAIGELRRAVSAADALGSPLGRWQSRAALADALSRSATEGDAAASTRAEAVAIILGVAAGLAPERAARYRASRRVAEVLAGGNAGRSPV